MMSASQVNPSVREPATRSPRFARVSAAAAMTAALLLSGAALAQGCKNVSGTISPLRPVTCPGHIGACYEGVLNGDLSGTFQSMLTRADPDFAQGTLSFLARTTIEIGQPNGALHTMDAGTATGCYLMNDQFVCPTANEVMTITAGARAYTQAFGTIHLSGGYLAGHAGTYQGELCIGKAAKRAR